MPFLIFAIARCLQSLRPPRTLPDLLQPFWGSFAKIITRVAEARATARWIESTPTDIG